MQHALSATALTATLMLAIPQMADAFTAKRGMQVNPVGPGVFEVIGRGATKGTLYWCGAADYAVRALGAPWRAQLSIARGLGPSETTGRRSAVQFTLEPVSADRRTGVYLSINSLSAGETMSVQRAESYCSEPIGRR